MKKIILSLLFSIVCIVSGYQITPGMPSIGHFKIDDRRLEGIRWGNWGSRPCEYYWMSKIVSVQGKKVIDLGVGLPSQYNWYTYVINHLKPAFYAGIDHDGRIKQEEIIQSNYELLQMDMSQLNYGDKQFDVAYCVSTFEHIPYEIFMKSIKEAHRVLTDDGLLVATLDERWDKNLEYTDANGWNDLEQSLVNKAIYTPNNVGFCLTDFLSLINEYFIPADDVIVDVSTKSIFSKDNGALVYKKNNRDLSLLNSGDVYNSCVSYVVLKKRG